jgi:hypothetical protein
MFFLFFFLGLFCSTYSYASEEDIPDIAQVKVNGDRYVAMIEDATADPYSVIEWVPEGAFVVIDREKEKAGTVNRIPVKWSKVNYKERDGFILEHLLVLYKKEVDKKDNDILAAARITTFGNRYINLRESPVRDADFIGCVPEGEMVPIVSPVIKNFIGNDIVGEWYEIEYGGMRGFVPDTLIDAYYLPPKKFSETRPNKSETYKDVDEKKKVSGGEDGNTFSLVDDNMLKKDKVFDQIGLDALLDGFEMKCNDLERIFQTGSRYIINDDFNSPDIDIDSSCFNSSKSLNKIYEINGIQRRIISLLGAEDETYNSFLYLLNNKFEYKKGDILLLCDDEEGDVKLIKVMDISSRNTMSYSIVNEKDDDNKEETLTLEGGFGTILPKIERACRLQ